MITASAMKELSEKSFTNRNGVDLRGRVLLIKSCIELNTLSLLSMSKILVI